MMHFDVNALSIILFLLFAVSEALSLIPSVKSNGVFQAVNALLRSFVLKGLASSGQPEEMEQIKKILENQQNRQE